MAKETVGYWAGPCPISELFDECMPLAEGEELPTDFALDYFKDKPVHSEADLSKLLCALINGAEDEAPLFPNWTLVDTSNHKDKNAGEATRVDLKLVETSKYDPNNRNNKSITETDLELKVGRSDAFNENPGEELEDNLDVLAPMEATTGTETRGQLAMYASDICSRQHRTHLFMLYFFHPYVRILRWDRSGVIVTERFNYVEDCTTLIHYLYRFTRLGAAARGLDPTVTLASEAEATVARERLAQWFPKHHRDVLKIAVPGTRKTRYFLVWGAIAEPRSPFGRGTRGYPAIEVLARGGYSAPMFLKEQWRASTVDSEVDTLKRLKKAKVKHVPTLVCGGSFPEHTTLSDRLAKSEWKLRGVDLDSRILTRLVVKEVGVPLSKFPNTKTLIQAIYDAFIGHQDAYQKCHILHRDISAGNILIVNGSHGLLSDWDLAKEIEKLSDPARTHERTGTWAFMSVELSSQPDKCHSVQDDIESFFWVALYHAIRYSAHTEADVCTIINKLFDECYTNGTELTGGSQKFKLIFHGALGGQRILFSSKPLTNFIFKFRTVLRSLSLKEDGKLEEDEARAVFEYVHGHNPHSDDSEANDASSPTTPIIEDVHTEFSSIFQDALDLQWPSADMAIDYYQLQLNNARKTFDPAQPRTTSLNAKSHLQPSTGARVAGPSRDRSSQKRPLAEVDDENDRQAPPEEEEESHPTKKRRSKKSTKKSKS